MRNLFSTRHLVGAAAWVAFSAAVWFAGDTVAFLEAAFARIALIVAVGAGWIAWEFWRARRARRENDELLAGLVGGSLDADSAARAAHELGVLGQRFQDALQVLRKTRFRTPEGEGRTVSQLPWYMFIGAPGSGKTTALVNAGLRFPLGDPRAGEQALQGVGGTRNCDWWFTDEAVLVDTAGRYTTQESDREADSAAWLGFLDLLKRHRPRQPLNGVIVTLSLSDLVHWSEEELDRYAGHVRERVRELYARLGVRLPVYLMVTKADLLAGFNEFFSELDADGRSQVWGTTFETTVQALGLAGRFRDEFDYLERRLYTLLPERLQETRDLQKRAAIYRFPQQFRITGPLVATFLERAFGGEWTGEPPFLRGVYFTSGTQEGSPIDRVLGTLARSFNLERKIQPPAGAAGKSYFLKRLLHEVIFGEAGLAGFDAALERRQRMARVAAFAAFGALTVALAVVWTVSFVANRDLISVAEARTADAKRELEALPVLKGGDEAKLIEVLDRLRDLRDTARGGDSAVLHAAFYQGDKLGAQAARAYRNALREGLLADLAISLENALRAGADGVVREAYVGLYDESRRDPAILEKAALQVWQLPPSAQPALAAHLRAALAERPLALPRPRDDLLVAKSRKG
ncbi:MAG TPA: type VI secretion system membrane subunit TssM [Burkholderiales bacterium]|nr:type VI secretion system membrane subunit TssM [Burkholderiales bacterium]